MEFQFYEEPRSLFSGEDTLQEHHPEGGPSLTEPAAGSSLTLFGLQTQINKLCVCFGFCCEDTVLSVDSWGHKSWVAAQGPGRSISYFHWAHSEPQLELANNQLELTAPMTFLILAPPDSHS